MPYLTVNTQTPNPQTLKIPSERSCCLLCLLPDAARRETAPAANQAAGALGSPFPCGALGSPFTFSALGSPLPGSSCSGGGITTAVVGTLPGASSETEAPADAGAPNAEASSRIMTATTTMLPTEDSSLMQPPSDVAGVAAGAGGCVLTSRSRGAASEEEVQPRTGNDASDDAAIAAAAESLQGAAGAVTGGGQTDIVVGQQDAAAAGQRDAVSESDAVSELKARLARVEAARDELARQQGQYKGIIAKVWGGAGAATGAV